MIEALERIEAERADGEFLVGDRFSIADLTAAALLSVLLAPREYPYREPLVAGMTPGLEQLHSDLLEHPGARWVLDTYARHRPPSAAVSG